jgi:hypothetical protein
MPPIFYGWIELSELQESQWVVIPAILSADIIEYCFWHGLCVTIQNLGSGKMEKEETESERDCKSQIYSGNVKALNY